MNQPMIGQRVRFHDGEMGKLCRITPHRGLVGVTYSTWAVRDSGGKMEPDGFNILDDPLPAAPKPDPIPFGVLPGCEDLLGDKARKKAGLPVDRSRRWDG